MALVRRIDCDGVIMSQVTGVVHGGLFISLRPIGRISLVYIITKSLPRATLRNSQSKNTSSPAEMHVIPYSPKAGEYP